MNLFLRWFHLFIHSLKRYFHLFLSHLGRRWLDSSAQRNSLTHLTQKDNVCTKDRKLFSLIPHSIWLSFLSYFVQCSYCSAIELRFIYAVATNQLQVEFQLGNRTKNSNLMRWIPNRQREWSRSMSSYFLSVEHSMPGHVMSMLLAQSNIYHIWYHHHSLYKLIIHQCLYDFNIHISFSSYNFGKFIEINFNRFSQIETCFFCIFFAKPKHHAPQYTEFD